jgi:hypothetical protein
MGGVLSDKGRDDLSLMSYRASFLIHPTKRVLDKIAPIANSLNILGYYLSYVEEVVKLHQDRSQPVCPPREGLDRPL